MISWLRPYRKGHIYHADGTLYMGRWSLFETKWLSARLHYIATADYDRHLHDHPWNFVSIVLRGGYFERRPVTLDPCFEGDSEQCITKERSVGGIAFRRATDRHLISQVQPGTWSLFIHGKTLQWWGFYTPTGKVYWRDYAICHTVQP